MSHSVLHIFDFAESGQAIDRLLFRYKGDCCANCGKTIDAMIRKHDVFRKIFQFHHIGPSTKSREYDNLIQQKLSTEQLDEVDKCVLLCVECHTVLHAQNDHVDVTVTIQMDGIEPIVHILKCQVIHDLESHEDTIFSDDLEYLELYRVTLGEAAPKYYSGLQLKESGALDQLIARTRTEKTLSVQTIDGRPMLTVNRLDDRQYEITPSPDFPLAKSHLQFVASDGNLSNPLNIFVRKGHLIVDAGVSHIKRSLGRVTLTGTCSYDVEPETPFSAVRSVSFAEG
jgi:hypothetical protein